MKADHLWFFGYKSDLCYYNPKGLYQKATGRYSEARRKTNQRKHRQSSFQGILLTLWLESHHLTLLENVLAFSCTAIIIQAPLPSSKVYLFI
jgi:hypothetical protein